MLADTGFRRGLPLCTQMAVDFFVQKRYAVVVIRGLLLVLVSPTTQVWKT